MKKNIIILSVIALIAVIGFVYFSKKENPLAGNRSYGLDRYQCHTATTSPEYMTTASATSSCEIAINSAVNADLNLYAIASTSASVFQFNAFVSEDGVDWYPLSNYSDSGAVRTWSDSRLNTIALDSTIASSTLHNFNLGTLRASHLKLEYNVDTANAAVYLEVVKEPSN